MAKGLGVLNKLAGAVDKYHKGGSEPRESSMGYASKKGPAGPEHEGPEGPAADLAIHDQDAVHHGDLQALEGQMCPGCHDKLRAHLVAKASGSKDPVSDLHKPAGVE